MPHAGASVSGAESQLAETELTLQMLTYATRLLAAELDTGRLTDRALDALADFGRSSRVALLTVDEESHTIEVAGALSISGLVDPDRRMSYRGTAVEECITSRQIQLAGLARDEPLPWPSDLPDPERECACLPLVGSHNRVIAVATLDRPLTDPLSEHDRQALRVVATLVAVSLENARLFNLATVDGLTGLYVRRYFEIRLDEELARIRRHGGCVSLIMTDIDHFKQFNDTYGHQQGDRVLRFLADLIKEEVRGGIDLACRYGGEEYVTILPASGEEAAALVAERLRASCESASVPGPDGPMRVTLSAGVATTDQEHLVSHDELVRRADMALYQAKSEGRNLVRVWRPEHDEMPEG